MQILLFMIELYLPQPNPTPLYVDNSSAIQINANSILHDQTKHKGGLSLH